MLLGGWTLLVCPLLQHESSGQNVKLVLDFVTQFCNIQTWPSKTEWAEFCTHTVHVWQLINTFKSVYSLKAPDPPTFSWMCTSASQLCRRRRKHIILLSPADCMKPLLLIFVPSSCSWYPEIEHWLPVPCCPAAWEWSAGVRTAGHYSVFRCAASYQCAGLTEAAALVNMPSARASSGGGEGDRIWRGRSTNSSKIKK